METNELWGNDSTQDCVFLYITNFYNCEYPTGKQFELIPDIAESMRIPQDRVFINLEKLFLYAEKSDKENEPLHENTYKLISLSGETIAHFLNQSNRVDNALHYTQQIVLGYLKAIKNRKTIERIAFHLGQGLGEYYGKYILNSQKKNNLPILMSQWLSAYAKGFSEIENGDYPTFNYDNFLVHDYCFNELSPVLAIEYLLKLKIKVKKERNVDSKEIIKFINEYQEQIKQIKNEKKNPESPKIIVLDELSSITRIFENAKKAELISKKTTTTQIVDKLFSEKHKDIKGNYYTNKSRLDNCIQEIKSENFYIFTLLCAKNMSKNYRDKIIDELLKLD